MTHTCHYPGCEKPCPPAMWGCRPHWFRLPKRLRDAIWSTYRPGQEITKTPSAEYLAVASDVHQWCLENPLPEGAVTMKALSIRQPWAWLILNAGKDIENRRWRTSLRGRVLVHAAKGMTRNEYDEAEFESQLAMGNQGKQLAVLPRFEDLERGGIVGAVDIVDCVDHSSSPWFCGPHGFVLANPERLPFHAVRGSLGFFDVEVAAHG